MQSARFVDLTLLDSDDDEPNQSSRSTRRRKRNGQLPLRNIQDLTRDDQPARNARPRANTSKLNPGASREFPFQLDLLTERRHGEIGTEELRLRQLASESKENPFVIDDSSPEPDVMPRLVPRNRDGTRGASPRANSRSIKQIQQTISKNTANDDEDDVEMPPLIPRSRDLGRTQPKAPKAFDRSAISSQQERGSNGRWRANHSSSIIPRKPRASVAQKDDASPSSQLRQESRLAEVEALDGALDGSSTPKKRATPRKPWPEGQETTPTKQTKTSRRTTIDDSEMIIQDDDPGDVEMNDKPVSTPKSPVASGNVFFDALPEYTSQPDLVPGSRTKAFADWSPPHIPLEYDKILGLWEKYEADFRDDHARYAADKLARARLQNDKAKAEWNKLQAELDAKQMTSGNKTEWWNAPAISKPAAGGRPADDEFTFTIRACRKGGKVTKLHVPTMPFTPNAFNVPHYRTYYPIKKSQLVQSDRDLLYWPEATEHGHLNEDDIKDKLDGQFHFRMDMRKPEVAYMQIGQQWQPYAKAFLGELNLTEQDMLRYLIDDTYDEMVRAELMKIEPPKRQVTPQRLLENTREQLHAAPQWAEIRKRIRLWRTEDDNKEVIQLKFKYLALAFYAVSSWYRYDPKSLCFNFFYCLQASPELDIASYLNDITGQQSEKTEYSAATHFDMACRICHVYPCFTHGLDSMWDYRPEHPIDAGAGSEDDENAFDSDTELCPLFDALTNLHRRAHGRRMVQAPTSNLAERPKQDIELTDRRLLSDSTAGSKAAVFFPCNHQGPCEDGTCHCASTGLRVCEKSCGCTDTCKLRFRGCKCARKGRPCSEETRCACIKAGRECDPDLCGICGVYEALDPQNRDKPEAWYRDKCQNCWIQRNVPKRTLIGESSVHGIGLFAGEDIKRGEYIGEYLGAKLNWKQAERSGLHLLLNGYSYLFDVTGDQTVDSMVLGNKTRFINSIENKWNCQPRILICNTEHRMALFASKDIKAGEELSYDYGEKFFNNHRESDSGKAVAVKKKVYNRKPYGKRGKYKKKGMGWSDAVPAKLKVHATMRKSSKGIRADVNIKQMVDDLSIESNEPDAIAGVDAVEMMDIDVQADSGDESLEEDDYSDSSVEESACEDSEDDSHAGGSTRIMRRRPAR